jgi:hypothetical protein
LKQKCPPDASLAGIFLLATDAAIRQHSNNRLTFKGNLNVNE